MRILGRTVERSERSSRPRLVRKGTAIIKMAVLYKIVPINQFSLALAGWYLARFSGTSASAAKFSTTTHSATMPITMTMTGPMRPIISTRLRKPNIKVMATTTAIPVAPTQVGVPRTSLSNAPAPANIVTAIMKTNTGTQ